MFSKLGFGAFGVNLIKFGVRLFTPDRGATGGMLENESISIATEGLIVNPCTLGPSSDIWREIVRKSCYIYRRVQIGVEL